jgi:hypothetical protein
MVAIIVPALIPPAAGPVERLQSWLGSATIVGKPNHFPGVHCWADALELLEARTMAKRTPTRSHTNDAAPATPAQPKARRSRAKATTRGPDTIGAYRGVDGVEQPAKSRSMSSEPSEEDIRMRAYQRYQQRGGSHGMDFEDWLEAERELKRSKG